MRTYYIFNVNREMSILTKDSPYMLFKSFQSIYESDKSDLYMASNLYEQLASKFNKQLLNEKISNHYKGNQHYMYTKDHHSYHNRYKNESCDITIKNSYMICTCNSSKMELLTKITGFNLFACDFENKDYFWLDEIYC